METDEQRSRKNKNERDGGVKGSRIKNFFFAPIVGINRLTHKMLNETGGSNDDTAETAETAILSMVDEGSELGLIEDTSASIINNALEMAHNEITDVMTHRINVVGISADAKLDDIIYIALDKGFSRLPVYRDNLDNIIGIIIVKDLLSLIGKPDLSDFSIEHFLREAVYIPESSSCTGLFKLLKEKKTGIAVVIDEYGGTAGIVTMEDLVEEIMGSIQDEYDNEEDEVMKIGNEKYTIDGETDPEEALDLFGYTLPENHEYETIAGFVTDLLGFIPKEGETPHVDYEDIRFVVIEMEDNCISKIVAFRKDNKKEVVSEKIQK